MTKRDKHGRESNRQSGGSARKTLQLCRQVERTVSVALASVSDDPTLLELRVVSVQPSGNSSRLVVTVTPTSPESEIDEADALDALASVAGALRAEVASDINRRRTPDLGFRFRPYQPDGPGGQDFTGSAPA